MLGIFWVKGPSGLPKPNERWSLVPKIQVAPGVEPSSLSLPLFPPTPESHSLAVTGQTSPSSSTLDCGGWDRQATSLSSVDSASPPASPPAGSQVLSAPPAPTAQLVPSIPFCRPPGLVIYCSGLSQTSCPSPRTEGGERGWNSAGYRAGAGDPR